jgi:catechol 2,3-dioxygenase-like lactoylglutathione lyase family enzyme
VTAVEIPRVVQVAYCTTDLPRSVALLQALGFRDAGGRVFSGPGLAAVQDLGEDAGLTLWWLIGGGEFLQVELFTHTQPVAKPRPAGHRISDIGWNRWALEVPDVDVALAALATFEIQPLTAPHRSPIETRVAFHEPWSGALIELVAPVGGGPLDGPMIRTITVSVPDLARARAAFAGALGMAIDPWQLDPQREALCGLPGALASGFVVGNADADTKIEVLQYTEPAARPIAADHLLSDLGIMHAAVGFRDTAALRARASALVAIGARLSAPAPDGTSGGTYAFDDASGLSLELFGSPVELEDGYGFTAAPPPPFQVS